jgi:UDP-N-acetyl-D-glucosamine dehydrogenase
MEELLQKFKNKKARVSVIGAGYVGLPFAVESATAGLETVAFEVIPEKVRLINEGKSYIGDVPDRVLQPLVASRILRASSDAAVLGWGDAVVICVPTPLNKTKDPDVSLIQHAADALLPHLHRGQLIVLESTTYTGYTREVLKPYLERTGYRVGKDIFLAFSPERVDPNNPKYHTKNTPKVIGGITPTCTELTCALYSNFIDTIIPVSSCDAAEMVKLLENTFRAVNIGLVNEVALMCKKLSLDTWEVIDAAASKPFGFMPFYPGPGLGGHCIPIDPLYLSWKLKAFKYTARFIELADTINSNMPEVATQLVADALNDHVSKAVKGAKVLVLGVSYKADINDMRESPALDVIELLHRRGANIVYHDPFVPEISIGELQLKSVPLENLASYDCVVITTNHKVFDMPRICREASLIVDTRNATKRVRAEFKQKIVTL